MLFFSKWFEHMRKRAIPLLLSAVFVASAFEGLEIPRVEAAASVKIGLVGNGGTYDGTIGLANRNLGGIQKLKLVDIDWGAGTPVSTQGGKEFMPYESGDAMSGGHTQVTDWVSSTSTSNARSTYKRNVSKSKTKNALIYEDTTNGVGYATTGDIDNFNYWEYDGGTVMDFVKDKFIYFSEGATNGQNQVTEIGKIEITKDSKGKGGGSISFKMAARGCNCEGSTFTVNLKNSSGSVVKSETIYSKIAYAGRRNHIWKSGQKPDQVSAIRDNVGYIYNKVYITYTETAYAEVTFGWLNPGMYTLEAVYNCKTHNHKNSNGETGKCIRIDCMHAGDTGKTRWMEGVTPYAAIAGLKVIDCAKDSKLETTDPETKGYYLTSKEVKSESGNPVYVTAQGPRKAASFTSQVTPYLMKKSSSQKVEVESYPGDEAKFREIIIPAYNASEFKNFIKQYNKDHSETYYFYGGLYIDLLRPCLDKSFSSKVEYTVSNAHVMGKNKEYNLAKTKVFSIDSNGKIEEVSGVTQKRTSITFKSKERQFLFATNMDTTPVIDFPLEAVGNNEKETADLSWKGYYRSNKPEGQEDIFKMYEKYTENPDAFNTPVTLTETTSASTGGDDAISASDMFKNWVQVGDEGSGNKGWGVVGNNLVNTNNSDDPTGFVNTDPKMDTAVEMDFSFDFQAEDDDDFVGILLKSAITGEGKDAKFTGYMIYVVGGNNGNDHGGRKSLRISRFVDTPVVDMWKVSETESDRDAGIYTLWDSKEDVGEGSPGYDKYYWKCAYKDKDGNEVVPWNTLRAKITEDNTITVWLNGAELVSVTDNYEYEDIVAVAVGSIGLYTHSQVINAKNFSWNYKKLLNTRECEVVALDYAAPGIPEHLNTADGVITVASPKDNGTPYTYRGESFTRKNIKKVLANSNEASVEITTGIKGYKYYLDNNETGSKDKCTQVKDGVTFTFDIEAENPSMYHYLHILAYDKSVNKNRSEVLTIPISYIKAHCVDVCGYCGRDSSGNWKHILATGEDIHKDGNRSNPFIKLGQDIDVSAGDLWGDNTAPNTYYLGYKLDTWDEMYFDFNEEHTLYRVFQPNTYKVQIHENTPSNATYDVVNLRTGGVVTDEPDTRPKDTAKIATYEFRYEHTGLKTQSEVFSLKGWSPLTGNYSDQYNTYPGVGKRQDVFTATADYNPSTGTGGLQLSFNDISDGVDKATVNIWAMWTPNEYTLRYNKNLNGGYVSQGGDSTGNRTEIPGYSEKPSGGSINQSNGYNTEGYTDYTEHISGSQKLTNIVTDRKVVMDYPYKNYKSAPDGLGDTIGLYTPRAYWTVKALSHYSTATMKDFKTQVGTLKSYIGTTSLDGNANTNRQHKIESTFLEWSRLKADRINSSYKEVLTEIYPVASQDRLVRRSFKNVIPQDHEVYATWKNNAIVVGQPERKYTVRFETIGGSITSGHYDNGVTEVQKNNVYTKVVEWKFMGWSADACKLKSCEHINERFPDDNLDRCPELCDHTGILTMGDDLWTPTANMTLYAHWSGGKTKLPEPVKPGYDFIGWFTKPQIPGTPDSDGSENFEDNGLKYGGGGNWNYEDDSLHTVDGDLTLYAWYNQKPVFVDVYDGLFFEGQDVTYKELMELVSIYDYEDDYVAIATKKIDQFFEEFYERIDQQIATEKDELEYLLENEDEFMHPGDGSPGPDEDGIREYYEKIDELKENIKKLLEQKDGVIAEHEKTLEEVQNHKASLKPMIAQIVYHVESDDESDYETYEYRNGGSSTTLVEEWKDTFPPDNWQELYPDVEGDLTYEDIPEEDRKQYYIQLVKSDELQKYDDGTQDYMLKTGTDYIGKFKITFQVQDDGIWYMDVTNNNQLTKIPYSDTVLEYTRQCQINFNYNPEVLSQNLVLSINEVEAGKFDTYVLQQMGVADIEDVQNFDPWWSNKDKATLGSTYIQQSSASPAPVDATYWKQEMWWSTDLKKQLARDKGYINDHRQTQGKLQNTLVVSGIGKFTFDSAFEFEQDDLESYSSDNHLMTLSDRTQAIEKFKNEFVREEKYDETHGVVNYQTVLNDILAFRDNDDTYVGTVTKSDVFYGMTGMDITFDAYDQWGKYASNHVTPYAKNDKKINTDKQPENYTEEFNGGFPPPQPGVPPVNPDNPDNPNPPGGEPPYDNRIIQDEPERSIHIIIVNKKNDITAAITRLHEQVRFISAEPDYIKDLKDSFWHTTLGLNTLNTTFDKNKSTSDDVDYTGATNGIDVVVRDFDKGNTATADE